MMDRSFSFDDPSVVHFRVLRPDGMLNAYEPISSSSSDSNAADFPPATAEHASKQCCYSISAIFRSMRKIHRHLLGKEKLDMGSMNPTFPGKDPFPLLPSGPPPEGDSSLATQSDDDAGTPTANDDDAHHFLRVGLEFFEKLKGL